jgi:hypothetical protein
MDILDVYPKDWHVRLELSITQVQKLLDFLDNCEFRDDPKNKELVEAKDYVIGEFFPKLDKLTEDMVRREI